MDKVIVAASTHWDREWYRTFQDFQIRLVDLFDELLEILEHDTSLIYTFDGQSVVLDDYLEIQPQNEKRIRDLVEKGQLHFGPLYNLPDEFLSGGEGLIRNFLMGHATSMKMGNKMNAGYMPDNFGHISQLPQILTGFGIDSVFFFRGTNIETIGSKEFYWVSPDGSEVLGEYMLLGYWSLKSWGEMGLEQNEQFMFAYDTLKKHSRLGTILLINGSDHLYQDPDFTKKLNDAKANFPDVSIVNGSIEDYADLARKEALNRKDLPYLRGEIRDFRYGPDPTSITSVRMRIKNILFETLKETERYAEPLSVMASELLQKEPYPKGHLIKAWKKILVSLGHDAVAGCSTDEVMTDVEGYLRHAHEIVTRLSEKKLEALSSLISMDAVEPKEHQLVVYNPHPHPFSGIVEAEVILPMDVHEYKDFILTDAEGKTVDYEILEITKRVITREFRLKSKEKVRQKVYKVLVRVENLPALGISFFKVRKTILYDKRRKELYIRTQSSTPKIENSYYRITVNHNGSLDIFDKRSGTLHESQNMYVGRGESGDEYQHVSPLFDEHTFSILKGVKLIKNSSLSERLRITSTMDIPERMTSDTLGRSSEMKTAVINTDVILYEEESRIEIETTIDNPSSDHIIFAKFPSGMKDATDFSHISFDEVHRENTVYKYDEELKSTQSFLKPMQHYGGVKKEEKSFAVSSGAIYEYHVKEEEEGTDFYLTLLRSTSYLFHGLPLSWQDQQHSTTPIVETFGSRELGKLHQKYALFYDEENLAFSSEKYLYPPRTINRDNEDQVDGKHTEVSFLEVDHPNVRFSSLKESEDGLSTVLRLYQTSEEKIEAVVRTYRKVKEVHCCNLLEENEEKSSSSDHEFKVTLGPKKILTIRIDWSEKDD